MKNALKSLAVGSTTVDVPIICHYTNSWIDSDSCMENLEYVNQWFHTKTALVELIP